MKRCLIVLPDDSIQTVAAAIDGATRSLRIKLFVFSAPVLLSAVKRARRRGVAVHVMLNPARRDGEQDNERARRALEHADIAVKDANPAFDLTHEKSMVVDDRAAFIQSFNWTTKNLTSTRDYGVVTHRVREVREIADCFEADWHRQTFEPRHKSHLIWCPGPGRDRICRFIDEAKHKLFVQNERFQDSVIVERLVRAALRGVKVEAIAPPPHSLKKTKLVEGVGGLRILADVGIKIHKLKHVKLHGKMLLRDDAAALVGSINFAAGSLDGRRELAIELNDRDIVERLHHIARHDWEHSRPLDLSDKGLLADLDRRLQGAGKILALQGKE